MPNPTPSMIRTNPVLDSMALQWMQDASKFVAPSAAPLVNVGEQGGRFRSWDLGDLLRDEAKKVGPGAPAPLLGQKQTYGTYFCEVTKAGVNLDEQRRAAANNTPDGMMSLDRWAVDFCMQKVKISIERDLSATALSSAGVWSAEVAPPNGKWNTGASTPIEDITGAVDAVAGTTPYAPNTMLIQRPVLTALRNHPDIVDRVKYTQGPGTAITPEILAALFGLERIIVMGSVYNSAAEGLTDSISFIAPDNALIYYVPPAASKDTASAMYTFAWSGLLGSNAMGGRIFTFDVPALDNGVQVQAEVAYDIKVTSGALGYRFDDVL